MRNAWLNFLGYAVLILVLAQCGQNNTTSSPTPGTFTAVYQNTLSTACIGCHVPGQPVYTTNKVLLDFTTQATAYQTLTTSKVTGTSTQGNCASVSIVAAGQPKSSYLATVLFSDYYVQNNFVVTGCSPYPVHQQDQNLSAAEESSMITWITNGALNN